MKGFLIIGIVVLALGGSALMWYGTTMDDKQQVTEEPGPGTAFFESPEQGADVIRALLREEDWTTLTSYYDLSGSNVDPADMISGAFFIRTERPEMAHPGGFWRYRHPFAPSFEYAYASAEDESGILTVTMAIEIDQGEGAPVQEGRQEFRMRHSQAGYQILPD